MNKLKIRIILSDKPVHKLLPYSIFGSLIKEALEPMGSYIFIFNRIAKYY